MICKACAQKLPYDASSCTHCGRADTLIAVPERGRYLIREFLKGAIGVTSRLQRSLNKVDSTLEELKDISSETKPEEHAAALKTIADHWAEAVRCYELEFSMNPESAHARIESIRIGSIRSTTDSKAREALLKLKGCWNYGGPATPAPQADWQMPSPAPEVANTWNGLSCRAIGCNKARLAPYSVFCDEHHLLTLASYRFDLQGVAPDKQPSRTVLPREYAIEFAALQHYQAPYCCCCNQAKNKGNEYAVFFCYQRYAASSIGPSYHYSTRTAEGLVYVCDSCRGRWKSKRLWDCFKNKALAHGCREFIGSGLSLSGWGFRRS